MNMHLSVVLGSAVAVVLWPLAPQMAAQKPLKEKVKVIGEGGPPVVEKVKPVKTIVGPDEEREILKEIKEAYKAPFEVHDDVLKELRRSYVEPSPKRDDKMIRELRRLYDISPDQEERVLRDLRQAYSQPSPDMEERLFRRIERLDRLPAGAVPTTVQAAQTQKLFARLDRNGDGVLSPKELAEPLRATWARWDGNGDRVIDPGEYAAYYESRLTSLSDQVAAGQIDLQLGPKFMAAATPRTEDVRPPARRPEPGTGTLPDWFAALDTNHDGQIGLYEWAAAGRPLDEFQRMDRNDDGFLTADEVRYSHARKQ